MGTRDYSLLQPKELEAVYAISRSFLVHENLESALAEVVRIVRSVLIFDNLVLYISSTDGLLEPIYAKAIGRGRTREADLAWGELVAQKAFKTKQTVSQIEEINKDSADRINKRYFLGLPVLHGEEPMGSLILIRFGGPPYLSDQIQLAEFIAIHVAQLIDHHRLVERIAKLEAIRRLDSLHDDFIATVSHELLTPLGFIKGYATTLLREDITWNDNDRREFLQIIDDEADRLRELIDNLLDSSRLQTDTLKMTFEPIRLETWLRDITLRASSRNENMEIILDIKTPGLQINADSARLAQVFDNILNNAHKYAKGSQVTISVEQKKDCVHIAVKDEGPGIPAEYLDRIFQRFYRVPEKSNGIRGTGLGLYICRKILQAHQGTIEAESGENEGTTFHIYLPLPVM